MCQNTKNNASTISIIDQETCQNCKSIIDLDLLDQNYTGLIATYNNNQACTISCLGQQDFIENHS